MIKKYLDKKISPFYFQMIAHWIYIIFSMSISPNLNGIYYVLINYAICAFLFFILKNKLKIDFSLLSFFVVINSTFLNFQYPPMMPWTLSLTCFLAILFKVLFRDSQEKNSLVNPSIAAIALLSFTFPELGSSSQRFWSGEWYHIVTILIVGLIVTMRASTILISLSYVLAHVLTALLIDILGNLMLPEYFLLRPSLAINLGLLSFGNLLFIFHVISDPQSGPRIKKDQLLFGAMIAIVDVILKYFDMIQSAIVSYLLITIIWIWTKEIRRFITSQRSSEVY